MQSDSSGTVAFIFWLEGLIIGGGAIIWSWGRWGRNETWLVGGPVLLALLWGTTDALMRFLPNLV